MARNIHMNIKNHICEYRNPGPFIFTTLRQNFILNHCTWGMYSPQFAATAAPPMSKDPDYRIQEYKLYIGAQERYNNPKYTATPLKQAIPAFKTNGWSHNFFLNDTHKYTWPMYVSPMS